MSTISASTTTTTAYKVTADTTGTLVLQTGATPTTAVTIDGSQNVGIGVTPSAWASTVKAVELYAGSMWCFSNNQNNLYLYQNAYYNGTNNVYKNSGAYASSYYQAGGTHVWQIAPAGSAGGTITFTSAMTLDNSGNLLVGTTSQVGNGVFCVKAVPGTTNGYVSYPSTNTSYNPAVFLSNALTQIGSIACTTTLTAYNVSSDYRLKENIIPLTGSLEKINLLKPSVYNYKVDPSTNIEGFIAHELQEVVPHAVTGEKDAVDIDGNPIYQGVDSSFLIPHLVAAIQEQQALITQLQADVAALKG